MRRYFITYGDEKFALSKRRIIKEAEYTGEFDVTKSFGPNDVSLEMRSSSLLKERRGGGYWCWKPDIILSTLNSMDYGDALVYADAGCSLQSCKEWKCIWNKLQRYDIIASRIYQRNDHWTRREVLDAFITNGEYWKFCYQFMATIIIIKSDFTVKFVDEWRSLMIEHPEYVRDVSTAERSFQHPTLIENRHDQSVYSALIYKYLKNKETKPKIYTQWEHIEDKDIMFKQAIRATRLRDGEMGKESIAPIVKRLIKDYVLKPFYYQPLNWYYSCKNSHTS